MRFTLAALEGQYGDYHATELTEGRTLWIYPLMSFYWKFESGAVVERWLCLDGAVNTPDWNEVRQAIDGFRNERPHLKPWVPIPA